MRRRIRLKATRMDSSISWDISNTVAKKLEGRWLRR